jgi:lipid-A-disaccharide synthase
MKIFVSAAEISSDLQAEKILDELIKLYPAGTVKIAGIGGPKLRSLPGFQLLEPAESLRAMGFTEVVGKLFKIKKTLDRALNFLKSYQPVLILSFDYPDFHFALLKGCTKIPELAHTQKICGIPPKVWVWRSKRIEKIRALYDAVWVLFPFEKEIYENAGIPVIFEGNPLIAKVLTHARDPKPEWNTDNQIRLAVMPGSRDAEITEHLKVIPETLELLSQKTRKKILAEIPVPIGIPIERVTKALKNSDQVTYQFFAGASSEVLARNSIGLIKSGTSTLEAAVLGCVPVIFYRVSLVTRLIFQFLIRYDGAVGLPNILLGVKKRKEAVFSEFLGPEATPEHLSNGLLQMILDPRDLVLKQKKGEALKQALVPQSDISEKIAKAVQNFSLQKKQKLISRNKKISIALASFVWSSVNLLRRKFYELGFFKTYQIEIPSVLVGNLQAGGAGKTPLVIAIAKEAVKKGFRVGVVSRAYGIDLKNQVMIVSSKYQAELISRPDQIGDEPSEIIAAVPEVTLGLGKDRIAVTSALQKHGINFLIFDDGFQNLKFKAQTTILAVTDATPSEVVYRDFYSAASSGADFIFQTKGRPRPSRLEAIPIQWRATSLPTGPIWLLCALADPKEVIQFYENLGVQIDRVIALRDHAVFDSQKVKAWSDEAKTHGAVLAVTQKDWVKLKNDKTLTVFILDRKISAEHWLEPIFKR